jgi:hypothetical protein
VISESESYIFVITSNQELEHTILYRDYSLVSIVSVPSSPSQPTLALCYVGISHLYFCQDFTDFYFMVAYLTLASKSSALATSYNGCLFNMLF